MKDHLEQIREQQQASWNKFSSGWRKWDHLFMEFLRPVGNEIINRLALKPSDVVLDVASGTGEPGLSIASRVYDGEVFITDLAGDMLNVARENAARRGIRNIKILTCDVGALPFKDESFDAISCRFGFMFFPDMLMAAKEMVRVLKPGGKIAASVWNIPEKNFWMRVIAEAIGKNVDMPPPQRGAPGVFRCAENVMPCLFREAGLKHIAQREVGGRLFCKTAEMYWALITEIAAPIDSSFGNADPLTRQKVKWHVYRELGRRFEEDEVMIESSALVFSARK